MTVLKVEKDADARTMVITAEFAAPVANVWQLWADPRLLERWWGPPTYPATFEDHDLTPGGVVSYFMTGPEGDKFRGQWVVVEVDPPTRLVVEDAFVDADGTPSDGMAVTHMEVRVVPAGDKTRMLVTSQFDTLEGMEQVLAMGMEEGMTAAMGQIDAILAEVSTSA